jgi:transposase
MPPENDAQARKLRDKIVALEALAAAQERRILAQLEQLQEQDQRIEQQQRDLQEQHRQIEEQRQLIQELKRQLYGSRSEKLSAEQEQQILEMAADLAEQQSRPEPDGQQIIQAEDEKPGESPGPKRRARRVLPAHLETIEERIEPEQCAHCGELGKQIGEEVTEELDLIPARLVLRRKVRIKRVCTCACGGVAIAPLEPRLLPGSKLGTGLGVFILLSKYDDHVALYTLERIFRERHQVIVPRQQMVQWIEVMAGLLRPLVELMWAKMKQSGYLQIDETPVKVLDPEVKAKAARGYLWFFAVPGGDVFLVFSQSRSHTVPLGLLLGYRGAFQSDGFEGYETLTVKMPGVKRLGCAAHARRKFYVAALEKEPRAIWFISRFRELYKIEDAVGKLSDQERQEQRRLRAPVIWEQMKGRAEEIKATILPASSLGKAVRYFLNEYEALQVYLEAPEYKIDNNLVENAIRPSCVGKKRWLFIGHPEAGWRSAVIYSILQSCRRRGINPQEYLTDVLTRLPGLKTTELEPLLPANWKAAQTTNTS